MTSGPVKKATLDSLAESQSCSVKGILADANHERMQRLIAIGIYPGVSLTLLRRAPLGDPLQVKVGQSLVSLRKADAGFIEINLESPKASNSPEQVAV